MYKTWEVVKMLSEDNELKFYDREERIISGGNGELIVKYLGEDSCLDLDESWELIEDPVAFMDAIKAYNKGKTIKCNFNGDVLYYVPGDDFTYNSLEDTTGYCISLQEILNGAWFIESED